MMRQVLWGAAALALIACGGEAVVDQVGAGGAGGTTTTGTTTTGTTTTGTTSSGSGDLAIELVASQAGAGCMPDIPPDPLYVDFTLRLRNVGNQSASADILGARVSSSAGTTSFLVTPGSSGPIPPQATVDLPCTKIPDTAVGTSACNYCGSSDLLLTVDVEVGGVPVAVEGPLDAFGCAF